MTQILKHANRVLQYKGIVIDNHHAQGRQVSLGLDLRNLRRTVLQGWIGRR